MAKAPVALLPAEKMAVCPAVQAATLPVPASFVFQKVFEEFQVPDGVELPAPAVTPLRSQ